MLLRKNALRQILVCAAVLFGCRSVEAKDRVTIASDPPGATVKIDGIVVGKTPYQFEVPGGYLRGTRSVFGALLRQQIRLRLELDGYLAIDSELARGPMPWIALNGTYHGDFWLLKTANFSFSLRKAATSFTGTVQANVAGLAAVAYRPGLPTEEVVRIANPAVLQLTGSDGSGSGFVVTDSGVAVTNAHVAEGQTTLVATTSNGQSFNARVEYSDPHLDLALLKLEGTNFAHLPIADLSTVAPGSAVIAIGSPSKGFQNSVTKGIVSAVGPLADEPGTWIQTDTAINPGNSGGPLLNSSGEVIGITTQKQFMSSDRRPLQGIGFALSAQDLLTVLRRFYPDIAPVLPPAIGSQSGSAVLAVSADVDGADIFVDGKFAGNAPSTLKLVSGSHTIRVEAPDRSPWNREIELFQDSNVNLKATLSVAPSRNQALASNAISPSAMSASPASTPLVVVRSSEPTQVIAAATTPQQDSEPKSTRTELTASTAGGQVEPQQKLGNNWGIHEFDTPGVATSVMTVTSTPPAADIFVDSAGRGKTPNSFELSPGKHTIQLVLPGHPDQVQEITTRSGHKLAVEVNLER